METCERQPQHYDTAGRPEVPPKFRRATCDLRPKTVGSRTSYGLRSQVSGPRSQVSGPRSQVYGPRSQVSGPGSQVPGPRSQVPSLRPQVSGPKSQVPGLGSQVSGPRSQVPGPVWRPRCAGRAPGGFLPAPRPCLCRQAGSPGGRLRRQSQPTDRPNVLRHQRLGGLPKRVEPVNIRKLYPLVPQTCWRTSLRTSWNFP